MRRVSVHVVVTLLLVLLLSEEGTADWRPTQKGVDQNENCRSWAATGECENNPSYMSQRCSASCKKYASVLRVKKNRDRMIRTPDIVHRMIVLTDSYGTLPASFVSIIDPALTYMTTTFAPYVEKSAVLAPAWIYDYSPTQNALHDVMVLCVLFSFIFLLLPYGILRHLHCGVSGIFMIQYMSRTAWIHSFITSMMVYLLFFILPKNRKLYITVIPSILFLYLFALQLYSMYDFYGGMIPLEIVFQMSLTQRLWMLTYNLYDGYALDNSNGDDDKKIDFGTKKCAKFAVKDIPNIIEYLGYCFCFANILGPPFEYRIYQQTCEGTVFYKKVTTTIAKCDDDKDPETKSDVLVRVLPNNIWHVAKPLVQAYLLYLLQKKLHINGYTSNKTISDHVLSMSFLLRMKFLFISTLHCRCVFYVIWKGTEVICNLCYFGFEGYDNDNASTEIGWENATSVRIYLFELSRNTSMATKNWNVKTASWLKRYVYFRHNFSVIATYTVSAVWHGFYPSYLLGGFLAMLYTWYFRMLMEKIITPYITPILHTISESQWMTRGNENQQKAKKVLFDVMVGFFPVAHGQLLGTASAPIFFLRCMDSTLLFWKSYYFVPVLVPVVGTILLSMLPTPAQSRKKNVEKYKTE